MADKRMVLDTEGAIRALRTVVFEKGADYVYPGTSGDKCFNFVDGEPSCIVGSVLALLGLTFEEADRCGVSGSNDAWETTGKLNQPQGGSFDWVIDEGARLVLAMAQEFQDARYPWGEALSQVESEFNPNRTF